MENFARLQRDGDGETGDEIWKAGGKRRNIGTREDKRAAALSTANLRDNKAITGDCVAIHVAVGCEKDLRVR